MLKKIIFYLPLGRLSKATEDSHSSSSRYASSSSSSSKQQEGLHLKDINNNRVTSSCGDANRRYASKSNSNKHTVSLAVFFQ
jgi:hypothetical protein